MPPLVDCYVYYRVSPASAANVRERVDVLFAAVRHIFTVQPRLQVRCLDSEETAPEDTSATWMEIYPGVPAGFPAALADLSRDAGLDALLDGGRHIECFSDVPCA